MHPGQRVLKHGRGRRGHFQRAGRSQIGVRSWLTCEILALCDQAVDDRIELALQADGSSLYTVQSLWTMARLGLNVTTVLFNNHSYAILNMELQRVGTEGAGIKAREMLDLSHPDIDFAALSASMGVPAWRTTTAEEFAARLREALGTPGPSLVEAVLPAPGEGTLSGGRAGR